MFRKILMFVYLWLKFSTGLIPITLFIVSFPTLKFGNSQWLGMPIAIQALLMFVVLTIAGVQVWDDKTLNKLRGQAKSFNLFAIFANLPRWTFLLWREVRPSRQRE